MVFPWRTVPLAHLSMAPKTWIFLTQSRSPEKNPQSRENVVDVFNGKMNVKQFIPSGKHTKNYGKSPVSMGRSTINGHFQ